MNDEEITVLAEFIGRGEILFYLNVILKSGR